MRNKKGLFIVKFDESGRVVYSEPTQKYDDIYFKDVVRAIVASGDITMDFHRKMDPQKKSEIEEYIMDVLQSPEWGSDPDSPDDYNLFLGWVEWEKRLKKDGVNILMKIVLNVERSEGCEEGFISVNIF